MLRWAFIPTLRGQGWPSLATLRSCVQMHTNEPSDSFRHPASNPHRADMQSAAPFI